MEKKWQILAVVVIVLSIVAVIFAYANPFSGDGSLFSTGKDQGIRQGDSSAGARSADMQIGEYKFQKNEDWRVKKIGQSGSTTTALLYYRGEENPSAVITHFKPDVQSIDAVVNDIIGPMRGNYEGVGATVKNIKIDGKDARLVTLPFIDANQVKVVAVQYDGDRAIKIAVSGSLSSASVIESRLKSYLEDSVFRQG